jgi:antitoxin (DNA-binding transcriptional repressor) of toxin-antitoxin stability system
MKSVGVKVLKNNLSKYLDLVRQGEVVLVTDRDEVIAELRMPTQPLITRASPWVAFLEEQARRGALRLASRKQSRLERPSAPLTQLSAADMLRAVREDRR